jgi:hypothetical protein
MPQHVGQTVLICAGIAWAMAGALGLYTSIQVRQLSELRADLAKAEALQPVVPQIKDSPVSTEEVAAFSEKFSELYEGLTVQVNGSTMTITAGQTSSYAMFREAVSHVQNGGSGWRVKLEKLCVGRECGDQHKLGISLGINKVSVENPTPVSGEGR